SIFLDLSVVGGIFYVSQCPSFLDHPTVQVFAREVTYRERPPINISTAWGAVYFSTRDMRSQLITGIDAASPTSTARVEANLISFGRIDAFKAHLRRADSQRVAINDSRQT